MIKKEAKTVRGERGQFFEGMLFLPRNRRPMARIMMGWPVLTVNALYGRRWEFFTDLWSLARNTRMVRRVMVGGVLSEDFRERLMLAVTAVYGCRYCSWLHTGEALKSGLEEGEIAGLLAGSVDNCPEEEAVALLYAQHWADSDAKPEPEAVVRLEEAYGTEKAEAINLVLRMNRLGNLSGNALDRFLYRVSFGRWGK